ncbi:MAG: hypothetical protein H8E72_08640 [Candidatus Marinimicrobia bacterium]|nr:hypothetical protein [Candidatus Neomarinimicrobiota bacterium]
MKFLKLSILLLLISSGIASAESANLLEKGGREIGLFQPLRWGYSENIELSTHPILMFSMPNISVKIRHDKFDMTSRHRFIYPTPLMRMFQKQGKFGLITPVTDVGDVPHIFAFQNEIIKSISSGKTLLTLKGGFTFAIVSETLDERLSVDLPLIYSAMGEFFNGYKFNIGADARHQLSNQLSVLLDGDAVIIPSEDIFWESKLLSEYKLNESWKFLVGTKFTYGNYPFGKQARLLPLLDITYKWAN